VVKFDELRVMRYNFQALFLMNLILRNLSLLRFAPSAFVTFGDTLASFPHHKCSKGEGYGTVSPSVTRGR